MTSDRQRNENGMEYNKITKFDLWITEAHSLHTKGSKQ